jgi:hypothetical protein
MLSLTEGKLFCLNLGEDTIWLRAVFVARSGDGRIFLLGYPYLWYEAHSLQDWLERWLKTSYPEPTV